MTLLASLVVRRWLVASGMLASLLWLTLPPRRVAQLPQRALIAGAGIALLGTLTLGRRPARWTRDVPLLCILVLALAIRIFLGITEPYVHDEENTSIPLSRTISFTPGSVHLPLRGENHPALPAYVVKASGEYFGRTTLGFRMLNILLGLATIVLIFETGVERLGVSAARWAAAVLAFNEYYLGVSSRATAHAPHLLLAATAIYGYGRFLETQRPLFMYASATSVGLAFYAKEHAALLLPVFFIALLTTDQRRWLRTPHPYLACVLFVACILPDVYWNVTTRAEARMTGYGTESHRQASYADHLRRFGGVALSPYPSMFYAKPLAQAAARHLTGTTPKDETPEYRSVDPALGLVLVGAVVATVFARRARDDLQRLLVVHFAFVFLLFSLIRPGNPPGRLDPVSWIWVETTMLPAALLAGARLSEAGSWRRALSWTVVAGLLLHAVYTTIV